MTGPFGVKPRSYLLSASDLGSRDANRDFISPCLSSYEASFMAGMAVKVTVTGFPTESKWS